MKKELIFDIQRFSVHDGPGIRTNVFLKGCPLRCRWCCNPESQSFHTDILYDPTKCIGCMACVEVCKTGAVYTDDGKILYNREMCANCGVCAAECCAEARTIKGRYMTVEEVFAEVAKDRAFYAHSGGGVTLSGGEPVLHADFAEKLFKMCKKEGFSTAVETCGHVPFENFLKIAPLTDVFLFDVKHTNSEKHRDFTGADNTLILDNLRKLAGNGANIVIRVPVIPEFNMSVDELDAIVKLAETLKIPEINFLPYHRYAANKYAMLGREYWNPGVEKVSEKEVEALLSKIDPRGIELKIGG